MTAAEQTKRWTDDIRRVRMNDGEIVNISYRRAVSYISRGMATWAEDAEEPVTDEQPVAEPTPEPAPAVDSQVAQTPERDDPHADRSLKALTKDELIEVAAHYGLDTDGTKDVLIDGINAHLSAAFQAGATAEDVPLSGSDSDAN